MPKTTNAAHQMGFGYGKDLKTDRKTNHVIYTTTRVTTRPNCTQVAAKEASSAISRATSASCKQKIFDIACLSDRNQLYPKNLPRFCHLKAVETCGTYLGCYKDNQKDRDMPNFSTQFTVDNTPDKCISFCLSGGYLYAGVQYEVECWCGNKYGKYGDLPESTCAASCPGNSSLTCGGYNAQKIYSTGLPEKKFNKGELIFDPNSVRTLIPVRIVFVLTVNGRAVRQVLRLINTLYKPEHYFYIHVDKIYKETRFELVIC
ncbi:Xylosyltransferase 2 [Mactra antiquata]